jgi:tetratricopeptide (TPR) repeat protein
MLLAVAAFLWLRPTTPQPSASPAATDALTQELVRKQLRLAQAELEKKNYRAALSEAQGVLKLSAGNSEATAVMTAAQGRLDELDRSVTAVRRLLEAGDSDGASLELSKVLELDPQYPPAAELSAQLNSAFKPKADDARTQMRTAREAARVAGAPADALQGADEAALRGEEQAARGEFALATGSFIEARNTLESARRAARRSAPATLAAAPAPPATLATPPPPRSFTAEPTKVTAPGGAGPAGFDVSEVQTSRAPQFNGRMEFEVLPPAVRPGEPFVVRIHLRNEGRKSVKIRALQIAAVVDGRRTPRPGQAVAARGPGPFARARRRVLGRVERRARLEARGGGDGGQGRDGGEPSQGELKERPWPPPYPSARGRCRHRRSASCRRWRTPRSAAV